MGHTNEVGTVGAPRAARTIVGIGIGGVLGGLAMGAVGGGVGTVLGVALGLAAGVAAGKVLEREERLRTHRTRELDAIIGITEGSLGAGPVSLAPPAEEEESAMSSREAWLAEWLTPPPPQVG